MKMTRSQLSIAYVSNCIYTFFFKEDIINAIMANEANETSFDSSSVSFL